MSHPHKGGTAEHQSLELHKLKCHLQSQDAHQFSACVGAELGFSQWTNGSSSAYSLAEQRRLWCVSLSVCTLSVCVRDKVTMYVWSTAGPHCHCPWMMQWCCIKQLQIKVIIIKPNPSHLTSARLLFCQTPQPSETTEQYISDLIFDINNRLTLQLLEV